MNLVQKLGGVAGMATMLVALAACQSTGDGTEMAAAAPAQDFEISSISVTPMTNASLCRDLGGQGQPPTVTIRHTAAAGVPIRVRLTDYWSDGGTYNHRSTTVRSDGSGTTTVNYGFLPPCNTSGGRINSHYQFEVQAGGASRTQTWARFDSASRTIR